MSAHPTAVLGRFAAELQFSDIPTAVVRKQMLHLLDGLGNGLYGSTTEFGAAIRRAVARQAGPEQAVVWGTGESVSVAQAAFANGSFANVGELEDAHHRTKFKPNTLIVPAAVALAEYLEAPGSELLCAIVAGTEVGIRVGEAIGSGREAYQRGWLGTGVIGALATAAAAASLMKLDGAQTAEAMAIGANQPTGIWASGLGPTKRAMIGRAAENGILAAYLAAEGIAGGEVLSPGWGSLGDVASGVTDVDRLTAGLGTVWKTAEVGLEWYPTKGALHSSIDGVLELALRHDIDPARIANILIRTAKPIAANKALYGDWPANVWEAQHHFRYCLAATAMERDCSMHQFRAELLGHAPLRALADNIEVVDDAEATALYPKTKTAFVAIKLDDGSTLETRVDYCTGEPENFPSDQRIIAKFHSAAAPALSIMDRERVVEAALTLDRGTTATDLSRALVRDLATADSG